VNIKKRIAAERLYFILAALFIASLVCCNLIFQKFFTWSPFIALGIDYTFELSVGLIPYPITFLVTDLLSELYGKRRANQVVIAGLIATVFVMCIVLIADAVPAVAWSTAVDDAVFHTVFGLTAPAVFASMLAYLFAQFIDIRIFHFWKRVTKGKMLWLRNNFSTIPSQLVDTVMVIGLLCFFGVIPWEKFGVLALNGFLFKLMFAFLDTPLFYLTTYWARKYFDITSSEELELG